MQEETLGIREDKPVVAANDDSDSDTYESINGDEFGIYKIPRNVVSHVNIMNNIIPSVSNPPHPHHYGNIIVKEYVL